MFSYFKEDHTSEEDLPILDSGSMQDLILTDEWWISDRTKLDYLGFCGIKRFFKDVSLDIFSKQIPINNEILFALAEYIKNDKYVRTITLNFHHTLIPLDIDIGARAVVNAIKNHSTIATIEIISEIPQHEMIVDIISIFAECLEGKTNIKSFKLEYHSMSSKIINAIGKALSKNNTLQYLSIKSDARIPFLNEDIVSLMQSLTDKDLTELYLENLLLNENGTTLMDLIPGKKLKTLSLINCHLSNKRLDSFLRLLKSCESLEQLDLSENQFNQESFYNLSHSFISLQTLRVLSLNKTFSSKLSLQALVDVWTEYKLKIQELDLAYNTFDISDIPLLIKLLDDNHELKNLNIKYSFTSCYENFLKNFSHFLKDPKRCYLKTLNIESKVYSICNEPRITEIFLKNHHLIDLFHSHNLDLDDEKLRIVRTKRIKQQFIKEVVTVCQMNFSKGELYFSTLPIEILTHILQMLGNHCYKELKNSDPSISAQEIIWRCINLIYSNFEMRFRMKRIQELKKTEHSFDKPFSWWQTSLKNDTKEIKIFEKHVDERSERSCTIS